MALKQKLCKTAQNKGLNNQSPRGVLTVTAYPKSREENALADYAEFERRNKGNKEFDVVLVGADNVIDLKKAYPNYFVDTKEFLESLKKTIKK
ncbi:MAG: hypothetical protein WC602_01670 [archaeon]